MIALAVAVFRPIEAGRSRVAGEDMNALAADEDGNIPVAFRGQAEIGQRGRVIPVRGQQRAGHILPQECLERARRVFGQRIFRQQDHGVLAGKFAIAERVAAIGAGAGLRADRAVAVQVMAGGQAGIGGSQEDIGIIDGRGAVLADAQIILPEERDGLARRVIVELIEEKDVRRGALDDLGDLAGLRVAAPEVCNQCAFGRTIEIGVEGGDAHRPLRPVREDIRLGSGGGHTGGQRRNQHQGRKTKPVKTTHRDRLPVIAQGHL